MRKNRVTYRLFPPAAIVGASLLAASACSSSSPTSSSAPPPAASSAGTPTAPASTAPPARTTAAAATPADTPPAAGTTLLKTSLDGAVSVISNGTGFTVVQDLTMTINSPEIGVITAYDADGRPEATITGTDTACGAADVVLPSKRRVILAVTITSTPAKGINPATNTTTLNEYDAATGGKLWSTSMSGVSDPCSSSAQLAGFTATSDGAYAVIQVTPAGHSLIINLTTGAKQASTTAQETLGNMVVDEVQKTDDTGTPDGTVVSYSDPATGARIGAPPGGDANQVPGGGVYYAPDSEYIDPESSGIRAVSLPSGTQRWSVEQAPVYVPDVSIVGQDVIGWSQGPGVAGYSLSSGAHLWTQANAQFCAAGNGMVLVSVNDQLATLSAATGKQLSYDPTTSSCPTVLPSGASWSYDQDTNQLIVTQYF